MNAQVQVVGGKSTYDVSDLWEWLGSQRALAGAVQPVVPSIGESDLGGPFDTLAVVLGSGGAGVVLAQSLLAWLKTRPPQLSIFVTTAAGTVKVDAHNLRPDEVLPLLEEVLRDHEA